MKYVEVQQEFKKYADQRAIDSWIRLGFDAKKSHGVSLTNLKAISKKVKKNHELALQLWNSGNYDEMLLATFIEEPKKVMEQQLDEQVQQIDAWGIGDKFCKNIVAKTPFAQKKAVEWCASEQEMVKHCGYLLLMAQAKESKTLDDNFFEPYLSEIETIQQQPNWVKESMNYALLSIGCRNRNLHSKAMEVAKKVGEVKVDYGATSCQTTNVAEVLGKKIF